MMGQSEYVADGGCFCPVCGDDYLLTTNLRGCGAEISQSVECDECKSTWTNVYKLDGYIYVTDRSSDEEG